jgi:hypothetical protein
MTGGGINKSEHGARLSIFAPCFLIMGAVALMGKSIMGAVALMEDCKTNTFLYGRGKADVDEPCRRGHGADGFGSVR